MSRNRSRSVPKSAIRVTTYVELELYAKAFADGKLGLLLIVGTGGLGKSRALRQSIAGTVGWIEGNASPVMIYCKAYEFRGIPLVLVDIDGLHRDGDGIRLLKSMCETEKKKTLSWNKDAAVLRRLEVPPEFQTTSPVAILANRWNTLNEDVEAFEDRGHLIHFDPNAHEVHRKAAELYWNQQIFDFIANHLHLIRTPSLRLYVLAAEQKEAGLNWRSFVLSRCLDGTTLTVALLKTDTSCATEEERVRRFVESGAGCRATYFNHAKKLTSPRPVPKIQLTHTAPPTDDSSLLDILRRRYGDIGRG